MTTTSIPHPDLGRFTGALDAAREGALDNPTPVGAIIRQVCDSIASHRGLALHHLWHATGPDLPPLAIADASAELGSVILGTALIVAAEHSVELRCLLSIEYPAVFPTRLDDWALADRDQHELTIAVFEEIARTLCTTRQLLGRPFDYTALWGALVDEALAGA